MLLLLAIFQANVSSQSCLPEGITFNTQDQIDNFQVNFPNCTGIEGDVHIGGLDGSNITNLNGLSVLTSIGGDFEIVWNPTLTNLSGLDNLGFIGGYLHIAYNSVLTSLTGLGLLTNIGGELWITNNSLTNLVGLESLEYIGTVNIEGNYNLTSLTGLENFTSTGGSIVIRYNNALTSLSALINVDSIGGGITINNNPILTSLTGLENIITGTIYNLDIFDNNSLSTCAIKSICSYLAIPNNNANIIRNATGCNDRQEVLNLCPLIGIESLHQKSSIQLYPNPSTTTITLELPPNRLTKNTILTVDDLNGKRHILRQITESVIVMDVSTLQQGIYIVKVVDDRSVTVEKLIIDR